MNAPATELRLLDHLDRLEPEPWDRLTGGHPFVSHAFLSGLIQHRCTVERNGWAAVFPTLWRGGELVAALPLWLKGHSYGEYVFDWAWTRAYEQHGLDYYPKLTAAVPFTPVTGPRLLALEDTFRPALVEAAIGLTGELKASSLHVLFGAPEELPHWQQAGLITRDTVQFHWENAGYADFDAFLEALERKKRKNLRQELRRLQEAGVHFEVRTGETITDEDWDFAWRCYESTYYAHGNPPYFNRAFFLHLLTHLQQAMVLVLAWVDGRRLAMALNVRAGDMLYGRYWGCPDPNARERFPGLHFAACYHESIRWAIGAGIRRFEGGAQGEHKLSRGLMPVVTQSAHWVAHPDFREAIARFVAREHVATDRYVDDLNEHSPFRA